MMTKFGTPEGIRTMDAINEIQRCLQLCAQHRECNFPSDKKISFHLIEHKRVLNRHRGFVAMWRTQVLVVCDTGAFSSKNMIYLFKPEDGDGAPYFSSGESGDVVPPSEIFDSIFDQALSVVS
jgi:hypothetical protein